MSVHDVDPASDSYKSAKPGTERDLVDCKLDDQFFTHLKDGLRDDHLEQTDEKETYK